MTERLRPSMPGDEAQMQELWQVCFGDERAYINRFFRHAYQPGQGLVLERDGKLRSMLLTFSQEMVTSQGTVLPVWYVYAFCTCPAAQGQGYGRRLLTYAEQLAAEQGLRGVVMVPGEASLFQFYRTLGYEVGCSVREQIISRETMENSLPSVTCCVLERYQYLRGQWLQGKNWIRYPDKAAAWQKILCRDSGGGLYQVGSGLAAVECWGGGVVMKEVLAEQPEQAVQALLQTLGRDRATVRMPVSVPHTGTPFGVVKWLDAQAKACWGGMTDGYLAFAFD